MLYQELKKSSGLRIHLHNYKDLPKDNKTYDALLRMLRRWLQEKMEDANLRREQYRVDGIKNDAKPNVHANVDGKGRSKGKGKGGNPDGKGKGDAKGRRPSGSREPGAKGKGKAFDKGKDNGKGAGKLGKMVAKVAIRSRTA